MPRAALTWGYCYYVNLIKVKDLKLNIGPAARSLTDLLSQSSQGLVQGDILILGGGICGTEGPHGT